MVVCLMSIKDIRKARTQPCYITRTAAALYESVAKLVNAADLKSVASACRFESYHFHSRYLQGVPDSRKYL